LPDPLQGSRDRQDVRLPQQQLRTSGTHDQRAVPISLADQLFFKWIKQHLRIKAFFGTSENAVKTQFWIAISTYLLVAILKKRLELEHSLYTILQILSVTLFEKVLIEEAPSAAPDTSTIGHNRNQLLLFDF
jgi:hypothetical protein